MAAGTDALFQSLDALLGLSKAIINNKWLPIWRRFADLMEYLPRRTVFLDGVLGFCFAFQFFGGLKILVRSKKEIRPVCGKCLYLALPAMPLWQ